MLTVLATLVKYTTDENEVRILYEYLAEASVVFPKVNPSCCCNEEREIISIVKRFSP